MKTFISFIFIITCIAIIFFEDIELQQPSIFFIFLTCTIISRYLKHKFTFINTDYKTKQLFIIVETLHIILVPGYLMQAQATLYYIYYDQPFNHLLVTIPEFLLSIFIILKTFSFNINPHYKKTLLLIYPAVPLAITNIALIIIYEQPFFLSYYAFVFLAGVKTNCDLYENYNNDYFFNNHYSNINYLIVPFFFLFLPQSPKSSLPFYHPTINTIYANTSLYYTSMFIVFSFILLPVLTYFMKPLFKLIYGSFNLINKNNPQN